jgi:hypothetical protein
MSEQVDFYAMKLIPPPAAAGAGINGGGLMAFFLRSLQPHEEAISLFLSMQGWSEVPGTQQPLVLSHAQVEIAIRSLRPSALAEFQERGFVMQIFQHSEDDDGDFDAGRFFR